MSLKSERLKKLEHELGDLTQWLQLGLVPKKDVEKHKQEIDLVQQKINEERERLRHLKDHGDLEEYVAPKRSNRPAYQEPQSLPEMDLGSPDNMTDAGLDMDTTEAFDSESTESGDTTTESDNTTALDESIYDDDDPFSDRNRWKRGILEDPDANDW